MSVITPRPLASMSEAYLMGLVFGRAGAGKTVLGCTSQQLRTLHLDVDRGVIAARCWRGDPGSPTPPTRMDLVETMEISSYADLIQAYNYAAARRGQYGLIVLDTATELQRMLIAALVQEAKATVADQRIWGIALTMMEAVTRAFRELGTNVLFLAHEMEREDEIEKRIMVRPAFQGAFKVEYSKHFSLIARLVVVDKVTKNADGPDTRQTIRALQCRPDQFTHAKDRSGALAQWELPVLDDVLSKMLSRTLAITPPQQHKELT